MRSVEAAANVSVIASCVLAFPARTPVAASWGHRCNQPSSGKTPTTYGQAIRVRPALSGASSDRNLPVAGLADCQHCEAAYHSRLIEQRNKRRISSAQFSFAAFDIDIRAHEYGLARLMLVFMRPSQRRTAAACVCRDGACVIEVVSRPRRSRTRALVGGSGRGVHVAFALAQEAP